MGRLLLVEFAVRDRFHRGTLFPFYLGYAEQRGVPARWLRYGVAPSARADGAARLAPEEVATLERCAAELTPDVVVFSHRPDAELLRAVPSASRCFFCEASSGGEHERGQALSFLDPLTTGVDELVGTDEPEVRGTGLLQRVTPSYAWQAGNSAAHDVEPLPSVYCGEECTFNLPFANNPFYSGVDLSQCFRKGGCAFCGRLPNAGRWQTDPVELAKRQLSAIEATCPRPRDRLEIRLVGEPALSHIAELARLATELKLSPCDFLLDGRTDTLVACRAGLEAALETLNGTPHRLHVALVGVESFSSRELRRLNKGIDPITNIRAIRTLFELERDYPESFAFREDPGLSVITFTPWTGPEELDLTTTLVEHLDVGDVVGKLLTGRLRLYPGLPLEQVARSQGLLEASYRDAQLDTSQKNFYDAELPWRFVRPEMEAVNQVLVRHEGVSDALAQTLARSLDGPVDGVSLARAAVRVAMQAANAGPPLTAEELVERVPAALREQRPALEQPVVGPPAELAGLPGALRRHKPVIKIEPVAAEQVESWLGELPNARARRRVDGTFWEVFVGEQLGDVERALELSELLERPTSQAAFSDAVAEVGQLLGYPRCCAEAFARESPRIVAHWFWSQVARRVAQPGAVPWELNPASGLVEYVPCSLDCEASLQRARTVLAELPDAAAVEASAKSPHLLLLGPQGSSVELVPESELGRRFRYRPGLSRGGGPDLASVLAGDEISFEDECVVVLRSGRPYASLSGRAFLWHHQEVQQGELWEALVGFRRALSSTPQPVRRQEPPESELMRAFVQIAEGLGRAGARFAGFAVSEVVPQKGSVQVQLASDQLALTLIVQPRLPDSKALALVGPFAISHPKQSPLTSEQERRAASAFVRGIERLLERHRAARRQRAG